MVDRDRSSMLRTIIGICVAGALGAGLMVAALSVSPVLYQAELIVDGEAFIVDYHLTAEDCAAMPVHCVQE